jgi:Domain of unknown function (DUF4153)
MQKSEPADWPQRSWALAIAGAAVGLSVYLIAKNGESNEAWRIALASFLLVAGVVTSFVVERGRVIPSLFFAGIAALIVGFTVYWNGGPEGWNHWESWRIACAAITVVIAAPLFQAWGDAGMPRQPRLAQLSYPALHDRAWMNVVLWFACWLFTGIVWLLVYLIGQLFVLIGIEAIKALIERGWFGMILTGAAFGAAAGLMRDRERILITLQTVVRRVLSVLAPVLGAALILFLGAMLLTGLSPLWQATKSTTPILISTVIVAIILANAAIGDSSDDESKMPIIRWGAIALGATLLPLGIIAAVSTALRVNQYGLTPERLWAVVFGGITCAYGLAYLMILIRRRDGWMADVRSANVRLAIGLCGLAFLLAMPFVNFGAWSTASQLARLESGAVSAEKFDWAAMRFDFGPSGQAAVERLAKAGKNPAIKKAAANALTFEDRSTLNLEAGVADLKDHMKVIPIDIAIPEALNAAIRRHDNCKSAKRCFLLYRGGVDEANQLIQYCKDCEIIVNHYRRDGDQWRLSSQLNDQLVSADQQSKRNMALGQSLDAKKVSIRNVMRRQIFVGDESVGDTFE